MLRGLETNRLFQSKAKSEFTTVEELGDHVRITHAGFPAEILNLSSGEEGPPIWFQCDKCQICYQGESALQFHQEQKLCQKSREDIITQINGDLQEYCTDRNMEIVEMDGDGSCFFHGVIDQLETQGKFVLSSSTLRSNVVNYMDQHRNDFIPFML